MAEFEFTSDTDTPLWELGTHTLSLPGMGNPVPILDRANPPVETESFNPDNRPIAYMVECIVVNVPDEHRARLRKKLTKGIEDGTIRARSLTDALRWISDLREEAEEKAVARQTGRPTSGPQPSTH